MAHKRFQMARAERRHWGLGGATYAPTWRLSMRRCAATRLGVSTSTIWAIASLLLAVLVPPNPAEAGIYYRTFGVARGFGEC
jgi:hypothetical protein